MVYLLTYCLDFSGREAFDLYLKCLQLILRHQLWFLVQKKGFPAELETIVYDLWTLRIAQFGDRIAAVREQSDSQSQSQIFNTLESEDDSATENEHERIKATKARRDRTLANEPNLKDCLALCYLGILTLRLPFTPGDIYNWVTDGNMAYRGAIKVLPLTMRDRLPPHYHAALDPNTMFKYKRFYSSVTDLHLSYDKDHGISWPALNVPVLMFRCLRELALPLEIYDATTRLGRLLGYDFALHNDGNKRMGVRHLPEAQLIGCLIVCVKLMYPLDDKSRQPRTSAEPSAVAFDWVNWSHQMSTAKDTEQGDDKRYTTEELLQLSERDIFSMRSDQIDQYLDFYADTFLDHAEVQRTKDSDDFRRALYEMFPVDSGRQYPPIQLSEGIPLAHKLDVVRAVHSGVRAVPPLSDDQQQSGSHILRPGQAYPIWKKEQDLPEQARKFYAKAARLMGLSMDMLILVVCSIEAKVEQWRRQQIRTHAVSDTRDDRQN
jgi:RNA polymerase I-specific transcription initiation factor RRN7